MESKGLRSPLKDTPLRLPGQSLHERLMDLAFGRLLPSLWVASTLWILAVLEWAGTRRQWPWVYTVAAVTAGVICAIQFWRSREPIRSLQLGRDGERSVAASRIEELLPHC